MKDGIIITALGGAARVQIDGLDDMQRIVGGLIQPIGVEVAGFPCDLYVNEEGKCIGLPRNDAATALCRPGIDIFAGDEVSGDAFLLGPTDDEGESTSLPAAAVAALFGAAKVV